MISLTNAQQSVIRAEPSGKTFLEGPAGAGKTTAGVERLVALIENGIPADEILVLVPQRTLALPYYRAVHSPDRTAGGLVDVLTIGGLARKMAELYWPLVAPEAGFRHPDLPPTFLNIETAQYHMARIVEPLLDRGFFEGVALDRNRLYSQILDNLNKAAFVGFPHTEIGARLSAAWVDQARQRRIYQDAQECANRFRTYCLANNLLDFSLVLELFVQHLWPSPLCYEYLTGRYRHLIAENIEEDTPVTHDLLLSWLPDFESALLIMDWEAGFRRFLGADPESARRLRDFCPEQVTFSETFVSTEAVEGLRGSISLAMNRPSPPERLYSGQGLVFEFRRFYPEMLAWVSEEIRKLVRVDGVPPGEIVILAPYLSDALRFSLMNRLESAGVPVQSHRPSRSLREEPAVRCLLTLAGLAMPGWSSPPARFDVAFALRQGIGDLDLVRAQLLTEILYRTSSGESRLLPFEQIQSGMQARITHVLGGRYDHLRGWLEAYRLDDAPDAPDVFFSRLFGEVLSQPGFGFHRDYDAGKAAAHLVESAREFRWVVGPQLESEGRPVGEAFLRMVGDGVLASQYIRSWDLGSANAVLLAPAYTFLMNNRPVDYQFWLNVSSKGWGERLFQPLTNPYVLSRGWVQGPGAQGAPPSPLPVPDRVWTDQEDVQINREMMFRLINGLLRRCRRGVFLGLSELDEHGYEPKGPLLNVLQKVLRTSG